MGDELIELEAEQDDPAVAFDRGVALMPIDDRRRHRVDRSLLLLDHGSLVARCSCWWRETPVHEGGRLGVIGHYAASNAAAGVALLARACELLASHGCAMAAGPMDGNTWRRYRFVVERGNEPPFFLEPDNPDDWPVHWTEAGFETLAMYTSALNADLHQEDSRLPAADQLAAAGIRTRAFDPSDADATLHRIYQLSLDAFADNFLYTPIAEAEFIAQYTAVLPFVRPELVILAERGDDLVGFLFGVPDVLQAKRQKPIDTFIIKTLAVHPAVRGARVGSVLLDLAQKAALALGYRRALHALIHESNVSRRMSDRYAHTIRRYALFARGLSA